MVFEAGIGCSKYGGWIRAPVEDHDSMHALVTVVQCSDDAGIPDSWNGREDALDILWKDVETLGGHDDFLLPSLHGKVSRRVPGADVTGMEPSVVERGSSLGWRVVVAGCDVVPPHKDLAVGCDLHVHTPDGGSNCAPFGTKGMVEGDDRSRLR